MKNTRTLNQKGFSLVELMIVVAIIGLLAAVGVPQYQKFQARARQGEAKSALSALYASEQSFFGEWNLYTVDLKNIGFGVTGTGLRYITGFAPTGCTAYTQANGAPQEIAGLQNSWSDGTAVCTGQGTNKATWGTQALGAGCGVYFVGVRPAAGAVGANGTTSCVSTAGTASFQAAARGNPNNTFNQNLTAQDDTWTIDQNKKVTNAVAGIK